MNLIKSLMIMMLVVMSTKSFARGGDDVGNGGFAYKQSVNILKMATEALEEKIRVSELPDLVNHPEWRVILQDTLGYEDLDKLSKKNRYRGGRKLAMDYVVNPPTVIVLKPYFEAFMGKTDTELEDASLEVQKRLVHEAAHIWGFKEDDADKFAVAFMRRPVADAPRPTHDISIAPNFCSCINGKSDLINNCDAFCATKPKTDQPILYVNTILGEQTINHPKLGSLNNWCSVQLSQDETTPQCSLVANDGTNEVSLPVVITPKNNSFSVNISSLSKNRTWILKLAETNSEAQTKEFQIRRINPINPDVPKGAIKVMPINQYICLTFGGEVDIEGNVIRTSFARQFYYFKSTESPRPMPPVGGGGPPMIVCHDEQINPGNDSAVYDRLEQINDHTRLWDTSDRYFQSTPGARKPMINNILEDRLSEEYGISGSDLNLFQYLSFLSGPYVQSLLGYVLLPFTNTGTGRSYCPTANEYNMNIPLLNLLGEYMGDTEALYVAESEAETILDGTTYKTIYNTMLVREAVVNRYGFYIENGLKIKITEGTKHSKTVYYYWPVSNTSDPFSKGSRKLFTLRSPGSLNGNAPGGVGSISGTSDRRIGCIPKGAEL